MEVPKRLRLIYSSNAVWAASGYAQQSLQLLPMIRDEGYPLATIDFFGLEGGVFTLDGIKHYPKIADLWGNDAIQYHPKDWKADVLMTLQDTWVLNQDILKTIPRWIPYLPVDHDPIPPAVFERMKLAYRIVAMSKFGQKQLKDRGINSTYIPHIVNTDYMKPLDKIACKKELGIPEDIFLFGMVSANKDNPPRKSFQEAMDAFKTFHDKHPKSGMYFHTILDMNGGFPVQAYANTIGIQDCIYKIDPYTQMYNVTPSDMGKIFNAFDCLLIPSIGEGFGIPSIEAQACGVPVITTDFTAMPELIIPNETGYLTKVAYKRFTPLLSYQGVPDVPDLYNNMEKVFEADRVKMGKVAREWILSEYEGKKVYREKWSPFLRNVEREVYA